MQPLLLRIDDRLLHAKVLFTWASALRPARIVLASDAVAHDPARRAVYAALLCEVAAIGVEDLRAAAASLRDPVAAQTLFVCGAPAEVLRLHEMGGDFNCVNLGGLHPGDGKRPLLPFVHLSEQDCADLRALLRGGVDVEARELPGARSVPVQATELEALWK
jgi:mannose/fructose/N-acetylgalactosamine-specific phosphotransferase system component IIB